MTCPVNCALVPPRNVHYCDRNTGKCLGGCRRGWHGEMCDQSCSTNCLNKTCNQQTGHCTLGCNGTNTGDFCNSTRECGRGWYGDTCQHPCSSNCVEERCHQTTGVCVLGCSGTYTGQFCNITTVSNIKEEADNLAAILVPVFLVVAVDATVGTVIVVLLWRRRKNRAQNAGASFNEELLLSRGHTDEDGGEAEEKTPPESGIMTEELLLQQMAQAEDVFVKTGIYHTVRNELEKHKHVTMSGIAGGGKTAIALVLGKQYNDRGFKVFFVTDVSKINLRCCLDREEKVCFIFHDIFKTVDLARDKPQVDRILCELEQELKMCKSRTGDKREVYAILTANTNRGELLHFGETFFSGSSFIDFTLLSHQYSHEDKKEIFNSHRKSPELGDLQDLDVDAICGFEQSALGFPQTCKLFFACQNFRKHRKKFFGEPFYYLREELETILHQMNDESSALILMFLCKDKLNIREVEMQSDNQDLENMFTLTKDVVGISSRTKLAKSIRHFLGTFFTKGDIAGFAHSSIYDACACALFTINPSLVLEYCHMKFLRDHVRLDQHLETSTVDKNQPTIHVSDVYTAIIDKRRASDSHSGEELPNEGVCNDGVMSRDWLDKQVMKTEKLFVKTGIYERVKETLETEGHVTMSGAAGAGKTAIALMLGKHYEEEHGFLQVHVADVSKFKLDVYIRELCDRSVCVIFHDIFRTTERSRDIAVLRSALQQLIECKNKTQEYKLYTIFTANTNSDHGEIAQLDDEGSYFFSGPLFFDFNNMSCQYTNEEKRLIFSKLCKDFDTRVDVDKICGVDQSILGFPQTCKLFVGFNNFQNYPEDFFEKPFHFLKEEINSILERGGHESAALILMFLCDGSLNLHQVELPSDNENLEALFTTMKDVVRYTTRTAVAMAVRQFRGSFFTKGDITTFAHPTIYDACAIALYKDHQTLVLKYASIRFLCEHVYTQATEDTVPENMVFVPEAYTVALRHRLSKLDRHPNYTNFKTSIGK